MVNTKFRTVIVIGDTIVKQSKKKAKTIKPSKYKEKELKRSNVITIG